MTFKHLTYCLFAALIAWPHVSAAGTPPWVVLSDSIFEDVARQFDIIHRYNTRNDELGRSERNIYMINFKPGQEVYVGTDNLLYFRIFNESPPGGHPSLVSPGFIAEMNSRLASFNGIQPAANRRGVTMYGFILENYYLDVDSDFLSGSPFNGSLLDVWKEQLEAETNERQKEIVQKNIDAYKTKIVARVVSLINQHLAGKNVLVHSIISWSSKKWKPTDGTNLWRDKYMLTHSGWDSNSNFVTDNVEARKLYRSAQRETRAYPTVCTREMERAIFHNVVSEIEFLTDPDIVELFNRPCAEQLHIWRHHPIVSDPQHPYHAYMQENPCKLKQIIPQTDIPTDEFERFEDAGCHKVFKKSYLIDETASRKLEEWDAQVASARQVLATLIGGEDTYVHAPSLGDKAKGVLDDKLTAYRKYVPGKKAFFLCPLLPFFLGDAEAQAFADAVAAGTPGFDAQHMTLFVVPFFQHIYIQGAACQSNDYNVRPMYYYFPAAVGHDAAQVAPQAGDVAFDLNTSSAILSIDPGFYASCLNLYKRVAKPYVPITYFLRVNGHVDLVTGFDNDEALQAKLSALTTGHSSIVDFRVFYDKVGLDALEDAERNYRFSVPMNGPPGSEYILSLLEKLKKEKAAIFSLAYDVEGDEWTHFKQVRLREAYALDKTGNDYNYDLYCRSLLNKIYNGSLLKPELLSFGIAETALFPADWSGVIYNTIDAVTVVAAFYGVDVIPDLFGFCYAAYRGDASNMALYGASMLLPGSLGSFSPGRLAQYGKIAKNGLWRAYPHVVKETMAERFGFAADAIATQSFSGGGRRRAVRLLLRDDLVQAVDALPTPELRVKFLEDFLDLSPKGTNFARHLVKKPELVGAWEVLSVRNVPDALRLNIPFLSRLSDNPNLVNFIDNLTEQGRVALSQNVDEWILNYDVRLLLKNNNMDEAIVQLGGVHKPATVLRGRAYILPIEGGYSIYNQEQVLNQIDEIITSTSDVSTIANLVGIPPHVVQFAKEHLFLRTHLVEIFPGEFAVGRFKVEDFNVDFWTKVSNGNTSKVPELKALIAHEYIEGRLMQEGVIYRRLDAFSPANYGAHHLSINEHIYPQYFNFNHWVDGLGRINPSWVLLDDFSNIDVIVGNIKLIEGF